MPTRCSIASAAGSFRRLSSICRSNVARLSARRPSTSADPYPPRAVVKFFDVCFGIPLLCLNNGLLGRTTGSGEGARNAIPSCPAGTTGPSFLSPVLGGLLQLYSFYPRSSRNSEDPTRFFSSATSILSTIVLSTYCPRESRRDHGAFVEDSRHHPWACATTVTRKAQ